MLPFSAEQFFAVFADYNESVWPVQWALVAVALAIVWLLFTRFTWRGRAIAALLALLWAWTAITYHLLRFTTINPAAYLFGALFLAQAAVFLWFGIARNGVAPGMRLNIRGALAIAMIGYALIVYPVLGAALGHRFPAAPTFGVPCPTTIFTLGILILAPVRHVRILLIAPLLWSLIGGSAAFLLGIWQDLGLLVSGIATAAVVGMCILKPCAD